MNGISCDCTYCKRRGSGCLSSRGLHERPSTTLAAGSFSASSMLDLVSTMTRDAFNGNDRASRTSVDDGHQRQLRTALLNGFGQFFIVILVYVGYQVYQLLDSFLRPLYWALLIGIVLFPFKTALAKWAKGWVSDLKASDTPLAVGIIQVPIRLLDAALEHIGGVVVRLVNEHTTVILWGGVFYFLGYIFNFLIYYFHIDVVGTVYRASGLLVTIAASNWVWVLVITHFFALMFLWNSESEKETIVKMSTPIYLAVSIHLTAWFGIIAVPLVLFCGAVMIIGLAAEVRALMGRLQHHKEEPLHQEKIAEWGRFAAFSPWNFSWWPVLVKVKSHVAEGQLAVDSSSRINLERMSLSEESEISESVTDSDVSEPESTRYLRILWKVFATVMLFKNAGLIPLVVLPTVYAFAKRAVPKSTFYQKCKDWTKQAYDHVKDDLGDRKEALIPKPVIGLYKMATYGDRKILSILGNTIDEASANLMICMMFVFFLFAGGFVIVQVQQETAYMVQMSGEFVDRSISEHPELLKWMPEGGIQDNLRQNVDSLYLYAREFVGDTVKKMVGDENSNNTEQISNEILFMMDRLYSTYLAQSQNNVTMEGSLALEGETQALQLMPDRPLMEKAKNMFSWSFVTDYVYTHFETIYSVMDTIITLVKDNATLIASMATSILSFVVTYFSQFLDFILNTIFFLASLSLLLSLSDDQYYPLRKLSKLTDYFPEVGNVAGVVELSINGIFNASFKMALFYGVYTYTLLSVFNVYVTFIPSVVASIFAVIPLFPTYIVILPALAELLFIRQDYFLAALMAIGSYLPTTCVDEVMYQEVKTAHPYLFGLAVAGGLMTFGIEGVVVGPVLLCAFVIFVELSRSILKPSEDLPVSSDT